MNTQTEEKRKAYAIAHWNQKHENAHTRKQRSLKHSWMPNYLGTVLYHRLLERPDGQEILFIWSVLLQVAGSCPQRGLLAGEHGAFTISDLAKLTSLDTASLENALEALMSPEIGWMEEVDCPQHLIVSGSLRAGRRGRPKHPEIRRISSVHEASPELYIEWESQVGDMGADESEPELQLKKVLPREIARSLEVESVAGHSPDTVRTVGGHATDTGGTQCEHTQRKGLTDNEASEPDVVDHTARVVIDAWNAEETLRPTGCVGAREREKLGRLLKTPEHVKACLAKIEELAERAGRGEKVPRFARFVQKRLKMIRPMGMRHSSVAIGK